MLNGLCNVKLVFKIKKFDLDDLELYTNDEKLQYDGVINDELVVSAKVQLPTNLKIVSKGKNLTLSEFWLGNIQASSTMLNQICSVTYTNGRTMTTTSMLLPGTMHIEIYSRSFIEYHLINKNLCAYE